MSVKNKTGYIDAKRVYGTQMVNGLSLTGTKQEYDEVSAIQNLTLGSALKVDERVYHYARAGGALVAPCTYRLQVNGDIQSPVTWGMALAAPGIALGASSCNVTHGNYGLPVATSVAANELVGGWIEIWGAANAFMWRRITSNTASVLGNPATLTITVDRPFNIAVVAGAGVVALHRNDYFNVVMGGSVPAIVGYESAVGITPIPVPINNFFWLQTFGPCFIASQLGNPGAVINFRDVYYGAAGTIIDKLAAEGAGANIGPQRIGYISGASTNGDGNNDVNLQLAPF
jgi:hypothetical protein